jgi:hypothetical protein
LILEGRSQASRTKPNESTSAHVHANVHAD